MANLTYEEFLDKAKEVQELDKNLNKQLAHLYVERGTMQQVVRAILDQRDDLKESLSKTLMINEENIRIAIGIQGQVSGIDTVLALIHHLMQQPEEAEENAAGTEQRVP